MSDNTAHAIEMCFDEDSALTRAVENLADSAKKIGVAITPIAAAGKDANGGHVESLTEAVMGMTGGLVKIAEAIESLANSIEGLKS